MSPAARQPTPTTHSRDIQRELVALQPELLRFAMKLTRNRDLAEDILQSANCRFLAAATYIDNGRLRHYMFLVVRTAYYEYIRRPYNRNELPTNPDEFRLAAIPTTPTQHTRLELIDTLNALDSINPKWAACILDSALGQRIDEAAAKHNIPEGSVKSGISRGRSALRALV